MQTRPIYHQTDAAIRGHVFCSFLSLILQKELDDRCQQIGERPEWEAAIQALDGVQQVDIDRDGKRWRLCTEADGQAQIMARAAGVSLPPRTQALTPEAG
jgi:hypothetical protein